MAALARCYEHGVGLERNPYLAADLYDRAARRGHVRAAYALGNMLLSGDAIGQDPARALELYQQAAQAGHMGALRQVGRCYQKGKGCQKDEAKAFDCFRRSAEGGDGPAAVALGYCYQKGGGCPVDDAQAAHWYEEAARRGLPLGQYDLGCLYEAGQGVPRDRRKALELYRQAAQEVPEACQAVRRLEKTGRTQRIAGWALVTYAILMGAGLWEGSAGDRIIWLAVAAFPAMAGGCCLHYGRRLAPPLSRIGRIALTVLGAVLAFLFVVGVVVLLDPAEAVDGASVWLTGCAGVGAAALLLSGLRKPRT